MVMIMLMRHAEAIPKSSEMRDEDRPLSDHGKKQVEAICKCIERPALIYTSPLVRSLETAELLNKCLGGNIKVETVEWLRPGRLSAKVLLNNIRPGALYISHNPQLEETLEELGISVDLGTGDVVALDVFRRRIIWHLKPSLCMKCLRMP
ncbi:hypothetical protein IPA_04955 [Ignicoccus pacificus DSM 13166]|uniref:Phosphohistidine phosphatase SixA n=1 Tax=Ignicoccus pacificus DSM 13166 TaxID=940294 RepID=A0A977PLF7_9CREN|nr:hypothetical protein IPA_04955 [Ignicoccus pacificus DSM 13166]